MRIIGGEAKGRPIHFPGKGRARPTSGNIKESLFNILASVQGKVLLDIFAGSGNIGVEALSRGAAQAVFIEKDILLADYIRKNLLNVCSAATCEIMAMDFKKAIPILQKKGGKFDYIFADPPYEAGFIRETCEYLGDGKLLAAAGLLIIQHSKREELEFIRNNYLFLLEQRKYGDTLLSFMKCGQENL